MQPPFLREGLGQLKGFHGIKWLLENEQLIARTKSFKHLVP